MAHRLLVVDDDHNLTALIRTVAMAQGFEARIILLSGADAVCLRMAEEIGSVYGLKIAGVLSKPFRAADLRRLLVQATAI